MAGRFSVEAVFRAVDKVTAPVTRIQNRVGKMTRSMRRGFEKVNRNISKFSAALKGAAIVATASLTVISAGMGNVIKVGAEFEQTLVTAAAKFPETIKRGTKAFKDLENAARKTGSITEFTASEAAKALNFLAMAGFSAEASIASLPGVVDLATVAQVDLGTATDIATDSLGAFGLMSKDASQIGKNLARINDVIAKTTTSANTTVELLFETIKEGGPIAVTAGASLETFSALAGELAQSGIKGGRAGTTLKNLFVRLAAPAKEGERLLRKFNIVTKDLATGDMLDVVDILGQLNKNLAKLGTADRTRVLEGIFGKIPLAGVNVLLQSGSKRLNEYRQQLEKASGVSTTMADLIRDTLLGRFKALNSAIEGVKINIFTLVNKSLEPAIDKTTEWVRANQELIATKVSGFLVKILKNFDQIVKTGRKILGVVTAYIALTLAIKVVTLAMLAFNIISSTVVLTITAIKGAIAAFAFVVGVLPKALALARVAMFALNLAFAISPVGLIIAAITTFIALAAVVITAWNPVTEFFTNLWQRIKDVVASVAGGISKFGSFFGLAGDESATNLPSTGSPQIVSPQQRVAQSIQETTTTSTAEVTVRAENGASVELTGGKLGAGITLQPSGTF